MPAGDAAASGFAPAWTLLVAMVPGVFALIAGWADRRNSRRAARDKAQQDSTARNEDNDTKLRELRMAEQSALFADMRAERDRANLRIRDMEAEIHGLERERDRLRDLARWWNEACHTMRHKAANEIIRVQTQAKLDPAGITDQVSLPVLPDFDDKAIPSMLEPIAPRRK